MCNNPNLNLVKVNAYAIFDQFHSFFHKILSRNKILTTVKGHNSVINLQKMACNNPNLDLIKVNAYAKFDQILSICSQDIERKGSFDNQGPQPCCKLMRNNPNIDLVNIKAYEIFGLIPSNCSQDLS